MAKTDEDVEEGVDYFFPEPEPSVPSIYVDCKHPLVTIGYSDRPHDTFVVSVDRKAFPDLLEAQIVVTSRSVRIIGEPFWTPTRWCWRCVRVT